MFSKVNGSDCYVMFSNIPKCGRYSGPQYLNIAMKYFETLISNISLADEKKLIAKIVTGARMLLFRFFDLNYEFFYEVFDLFSKVNGSDCYVMFSNIPKCGPYSGLQYNLQIIVF